jgi:hypothetical protein
LAAGATYTPIQTTTLGSAQASYTFSSIPSTYTDLVLIYQSANAPSAAYIGLQFNSDTSGSGTNYSATVMYGEASAGSARTTNNYNIRVVHNANQANNMMTCSIMNYANATTYKTVLARNGGAAYGTYATVGLWRATAAISSVVVYGDSGNLASGTVLSLYGITAA